MDRKTIKESLAALSLIASLLFVGYEIRQNTAMARAATYQDIGFSVLETWRQYAHDPQLVGLLETADDSTRWDELSDPDWRQLSSVILGSMRAWEALYRQVDEGILPPEALQWFGYGLELPDWWAALWPEVKASVPADFREYVSSYYGWE
ncbi:MAG: hypothetical protein OXU39_11625 [Gemmatimonadota bacterium]|nr:hypothetical protein [Gemmatimonadota bacterium]MDE3006730.1 hypothetical protein [Gemmatimonadota bacterium]